MVYENVSGEVVVGGVFLRLLIKQPNWAFRKPREFLVAIMEKYIQLATKSNLEDGSLQSLEQVTDALTALLHAQNELANHVPQLGHLHKLADVLKRPNEHVQASILRVCNELASSQACVRGFGGLECVAGLQQAMKGCTRSALVPACELLKKLYEENSPGLVRNK